MQEYLLGGASMITAIGALLFNLSQIMKSRAETRKILAELSPNHGSSTKDMIKRVEDNMNVLIMDVAAIRDEQIKLADADKNDRRIARIEHAKIWRKINQIGSNTNAK